MKLNRSEIMRRAWVIVRRFMGNGETVAALLSRALKSVWYSVKQEAAADRAAAKRAAAAAIEAARPAAALFAEIVTLDNRDFHSAADRLRLSELRRAYAVATQREGLAA